MWGTPLDIRSDEFLTGTAAELNVLALGHASSSPLSYSPDLVIQVASGQPFETLFFFEGNLLRLGPLAPRHDAVRGLPGVAPARPGADAAAAAAAAGLNAGRCRGSATPWSSLAPATLWWSFTPARVLSFASLGCFLLVVATERWTAATATRSRAAALALAAAGGIALARLGTYYVPWSLTIGVPLVLARRRLAARRSAAPRRPPRAGGRRRLRGGDAGPGVLGERRLRAGHAGHGVPRPAPVDR